MAYAARAEHHAVACARARRRAGRLETARLATALALAALVLAAGRGRIVPAWAAAGGGVGVLAFAALVRASGRARARERAGAARHAAAARGVARVGRDWAALPVPAWGAPASTALGTSSAVSWPPLADDLQLFGRASLAQRLDVVTPLCGGPRLAAWLLADPPDATEIGARQAAVRALAGWGDLLEDCAALAADARAVPPGALGRLLAWAEGAPDPRAAAVRAAAWAGPLFTLAALGAGLARVVPLAAALAASVAGNAAAAALARRPLRALLAPVADLPALLAPLVALLARIDAEPVAAPAWVHVQGRLRRAGGAVPALRRLARWAAWAETRHSPMLYGALAATLAWDARLAAGLETWRRAAGAAARDWFDALAEGEALVALATLAHDNPTWAFPDLLPDRGPDSRPYDAPGSAASLAARALGHPLLPAAGRVGNDVRLGGPGSLLVVSGSNMAGKSTLLRAVGVNVLLAQAGGPVCAAAMRWRRARVRTSVRVADALDAGVSLFLAELRRLQGVVAAAAETTAVAAGPEAGAAGTASAAGAGGRGAPPVLYLFDEVLHGTNSGDRRAATRAVLARLHAHGAAGLVTTHDLELADAPDLAPAATHLHFREAYAAGADGPRMTFDYVARPGRATTANALALLAMLGLGPRPEPPAGGA